MVSKFFVLGIFSLSFGACQCAKFVSDCCFSFNYVGIMTVSVVSDAVYS